MKLANHFDVLLKDTVNLPQPKLDQLSGRVDSIYAALSNDSDLGERVLAKIPQGSWPQKTIIKPKEDQEFDADFMLQLEHEPEWDAHPSAYSDAVYRALSSHPVYGSMDVAPTRKCRCVRVTYANDFHVDIVPYVVTPTGKYIVNRDEDKFELTDPEALTSWMKAKDNIADGNLRRVLRLLKFLRRDSNWTGTRSVILTTLVGQRVDPVKKVFDSSYYSRLPDALLHIVQDLDDWLQDQERMPTVWDPSGTGLTFDHRWVEATYLRFKQRINDYRPQIEAAHSEQDRDASIQMWQQIFGSGFDAPEMTTGSGGPFGTVATSSSRRSGRAG